MNTLLLRDAGLTEGEAKVYLAILELGSTRTGKIIALSGIAKSIVYPILTKLMKKGLVSSIIKERTTYYTAEAPQKILEYIEQRKSSLDESKRAIEEIMPQLLAKTASAQQNDCRLFLGFKGMTTAYEKMYKKLRKGDDYFVMGIGAETPSHHESYFQKDHIHRVKAGIRVRLLFHVRTSLERLQWRNKLWGCDARLMPIKIDTPAWFAGYKDVTLISIVAEEIITLEIINKQIADSFRTYFEEFWKQSTKIPKR